MPKLQDIQAYQGDTFSMRAKFVDSSNSPVSVEGSSFYMEARRVGVRLPEIVFTPVVSNNIVTIHANGSDMDTYDYFAYDLREELPDGTKVTHLYGGLKIESNITPLTGTGIEASAEVKEYTVVIEQRGNQPEPLPTLGTPQPTATALSTSSIALSWAAISNASSYDIYRNNSFLKNQALTFLTDINLSPSSLYTYKVQAKADGYTSSAYGTASATTQTPVPIDGAISNLTTTTQLTAATQLQ